MATDFQEKACEKALREYRKKYLTKKENLNADESTARLMVNSLLSVVLGYTLIDEIKTEHMIRGTYVDYVVQLNKKIHLLLKQRPPLLTSMSATSNRLLTMPQTKALIG